MQKSPPTFQSPPAFLARVPRSILRKLDAADALLAARNHSAAFGPYIALGSLRSTLVAARTQHRRIRRAKDSIWQGPRPGRRLRSLFFEIHFYLICWARIAKLASFVTRATGFRRPKLVLKQYHTRLKQMSDFRDHLEHFEERLPGGSRHQALRVPGDLFNVAGDSASIGGDTVNVGEESLRLLVAIVDEFETAVLFDALETLWSADPARVSHLVRQAALRVEIPRTIRQIHKMLGYSPPSKVSEGNPP